MGVVYHARYIVWLDQARTEYLRAAGMSYRELEETGYRMAVGSLSMRYRRPARYDDSVDIRCWVRETESRRVTFGYAVEHAETRDLLATATTEMMVLNESMRPTSLPASVSALLRPIADPVRLRTDVA